MNTIRFTSKALLVTLVAGLAFTQASAALPTFAALRAAAQSAATYAQPALTKAGQVVVNVMPKSMAGRLGLTATTGVATGAAVTAATTSPATQVVEKVVEVDGTPKALAPFFGGVILGAGIDGVRAAYNLSFDETNGSNLKKAAVISPAVLATAAAAYFGAPSLATVKEMASFAANNKLSTAMKLGYTGIQALGGYLTYAATKAGLKSLATSKEAEDQANCKSGVFAVPTRPTVTTPAAPVVSQRTDNSLDRDVTVNGKRISFYQVLPNGTYRAIQRGQEKVKGMNVIRPDHLPQGAVVVNA